MKINWEHRPTAPNLNHTAGDAAVIGHYAGASVPHPPDTINYGARLQFLIPRRRRLRRHRLHLFLDGACLHRPLVRSGFLSWNDKRRRFHFHSRHEHIQLPPRHLHGSGPSPNLIRARCWGPGQPDPRDQAQGMSIILCFFSYAAFYSWFYGLICWLIRKIGIW